MQYSSILSQTHTLRHTYSLNTLYWWYQALSEKESRLPHCVCASGVSEETRTQAGAGLILTKACAEDH